MSYIKELQKGNETLSNKNKMLEEKILILEEKIRVQRVEYKNLMNDRNEVFTENTKLKNKLEGNTLDRLIAMGSMNGFSGVGRSKLFEMEEY